MSLEMCKRLSLQSRIALLQKRIASEETTVTATKKNFYQDGDNGTILYYFSYTPDAENDILVFRADDCSSKGRNERKGCYLVDFEKTTSKKKRSHIRSNNHTI